jgi:short-subunit dehydrogenase
MTDQVVWITGASAGIGKAIAQEYHRRGWHVVLSARSAGKLEAIAEDLGSRVTVLPIDVTDRSQIASAVCEIRQHLGRLDLLVNNAGISQRSKIIDTEIHVFRRLMEVNYLGSVQTTKIALDLLLETKGHVAVISSVAGKIGAPLRSGYAASKHALHGFFDCLRAEHHRDGLGVTIVCPGYVNTDVDVNALGNDGKPTGNEDADNRNGLSPDEVARRMANAIAKNKAEIYIGGKEVLAIYLKRYVPGVLRRLLANRS